MTDRFRRQTATDRWSSWRQHSRYQATDARPSSRGRPSSRPAPLLEFAPCQCVARPLAPAGVRARRANACSHRTPCRIQHRSSPRDARHRPSGRWSCARSCRPDVRPSHRATRNVDQQCRRIVQVRPIAPEYRWMRHPVLSMSIPCSLQSRLDNVVEGLVAFSPRQSVNGSVVVLITDSRSVGPCNKPRSKRAFRAERGTMAAHSRL